FSNNEIPKNQCDQESCHGCRNGAECNIKENVEPDEVGAQAMEVVHHTEIPDSERRSANCSMTSSVRAARLPLIKTRSPGAAILLRSSAASDVDLTTVLSSRPACWAVSAIAAATFPIAINRSMPKAAAVSPASR